MTLKSSRHSRSHWWMMCALMAASAPGVRAETPAVDPWKQEMERKINVLTEELEKSKLAPADQAAEASETPQGGQEYGHAASKVYRKAKGVSFGGYGEMIYSYYDHERENKTPSNLNAGMDLLRFVLYTGYKFSDKILFNSELEVEHANTSKSGEVSVEFAYVDFLLGKPLAVRVGKLLLPVGLVNEYHEPTTFHSALRPEVEQNIIPTTWAENGVGAHGDVGPLTYRAYAVAGLRGAADASAGQEGFLPDVGVREGRQEGSETRAKNIAFAGRLDYVGLPGTLIGASIVSGGAGQGDKDPSGNEIKAPVTLWDAHARTEWKGVEVRALYAQGTIGGVGELNATNGLTGNQSIGEKIWGGYAEIAYNVLPLILPNTNQSVSPFFRYERYNTQAGVPGGFESDPANDRRLYVYGASYKPLSNVILKADYTQHHNGARTGTHQVNLAMGYEF